LGRRRAGTASAAQNLAQTKCALAALLLSVGLVACSFPTQEAPRVGTCDPFQIVNVHPGANATDVSPDVKVTVTFNDFPDPDSVDTSTLRLFTGLFYHTGRFGVDLIERQAFFQPAGSLTLGRGYTVIVEPGIRSLRGCQLNAPPPTSDGMHPDSYAVMFTTLDPELIRPLPPVASPPTFADVVGVFGGHCAGAGCHLGDGMVPTDDAGCLRSSGAGLSLCARDARVDLLGVPSSQVDGLVLVVPGDSSRSYLLRKLVGAPPVTGHFGSPQGEVSVEDLRRIQHWIEAGAPGPASAN
jgi:hypothetical protein